MKLVSIHPAQTPDITAEHDPKLPVPRPYHIEPNGNVARQDYWRGSPFRLIGFSPDMGTGSLVLSVRSWLDGDLQRAVGKFPVFATTDDQWDTYGLPAERVTVHEDDAR